MDFIVDLIVLHIIANEDIVLQTYSDYPVTTIPTRIADRVGIFYADAGTACISKKITSPPSPFRRIAIRYVHKDHLPRHRF